MFTADALVRLLESAGVDLFVVCPGSRSTPLAAAIDGSTRVSRVVITDERAAGYYATGFIRATGRTAAVISTSGTAVANLLPATVEAYQSRLPLVLLTADRPGELQNCGANQTIDQAGIYGRFVREYVQVPATVNDNNLPGILDRCGRAVAAAAVFREPVHINCRFREPLAPAPAAYDYDALRTVADRFFGRPLEENSPDFAGSTTNVETLAGDLRGARRGLIVAGPQNPVPAADRLPELAAATGWPVFADILSRHRLSAVSSRRVFGAYDLFLDGQPPPAPDVVLHVGGPPTSARLARYLAAARGTDYVKIQDHNRLVDPDRLETARIVGNIDSIVERMIDRFAGAGDRSWYDEMRKREYHGRFLQRESAATAQRGLGEPAVAALVGRRIRRNDALFLSNSMPVRDAETFMRVRDAGVCVGANRGASGIDGIIASACGFAAGSNRRTTLVTGDLAFLHDLGSLALAARSDVPVVVVVLNNDGGGIFSFLPISQFPDVFERYFGTAHGIGFKAAADLFGLPHFHPADAAGFCRTYGEVLEDNRSAVIEVGLSRAENVEDHESVRRAWRRLYRRAGERDLER